MLSSISKTFFWFLAAIPYEFAALERELTRKISSQKIIDTASPPVVT